MKKLILISALLFSFNGWSITDYKPYDENAIAGEEIPKALKKQNQTTGMFFFKWVVTGVLIAGHWENIFQGLILKNGWMRE